MDNKREPMTSIELKRRKKLEQFIKHRDVVVASYDPTLNSLSPSLIEAVKKVMDEKETKKEKQDKMVLNKTSKKYVNLEPKVTHVNEAYGIVNSDGKVIKSFETEEEAEKALKGMSNAEDYEIAKLEESRIVEAKKVNLANLKGMSPRQRAQAIMDAKAGKESVAGNPVRQAPKKSDDEENTAATNGLDLLNSNSAKIERAKFRQVVSGLRNPDHRQQITHAISKAKSIPEIRSVLNNPEDHISAPRSKITLPKLSFKEENQNLNEGPVTDFALDVAPITGTYRDARRAYRAAQSGDYASALGHGVMAGIGSVADAATLAATLGTGGLGAAPAAAIRSAGMGIVKRSPELLKKAVSLLSRLKGRPTEKITAADAVRRMKEMDAARAVTNAQVIPAAQKALPAPTVQRTSSTPPPASAGAPSSALAPNPPSVQPRGSASGPPPASAGTPPPRQQSGGVPPTGGNVPRDPSSMLASKQAAKQSILDKLNANWDKWKQMDNWQRTKAIGNVGWKMTKGTGRMARGVGRGLLRGLEFGGYTGLISPKGKKSSNALDVLNAATGAKNTGISVQQ